MAAVRSVLVLAGSVRFFSVRSWVLVWGVDVPYVLQCRQMLSPDVRTRNTDALLRMEKGRLMSSSADQKRSSGVFYKVSTSYVAS